MKRSRPKFVFIPALILSMAAFGGPTLPDVDGHVATFHSDQSDGLSVRDGTTPSSRDIFTVNVIGLTNEIRPAAGTSGVYFHNLRGDNAFLYSGSAQETVSIVTTGSDAKGIVGIAQGVTQSSVPDDPFLGVPLIGEDPAVPGGQVNITSYSTITTQGEDAHGIYAYSDSAGYPASVISRLEDFEEGDKYNFTVTEVQDAEGQPAVFDPDDTVTVRGFLVLTTTDEDGNVIAVIDDQGHLVPVTDDQGDIVDFGTFVIGKDGAFTASFSDDEKADSEALGIGESMTVAVCYTVEAERKLNSETRIDEGSLVVVFERVEGAEEGDDSFIREIMEAHFDTFGVSGKPSQESNATVFPDLNAYVDNKLAEATAGGAGGGVSVTSHGNIETDGEGAHGIYAYSQGGQGAGGRGGSIRRSAGAGSPGKSPGSVTVFADGRIVTHQDESNGITALSAGGPGGPGGNGGAWRHGQKGGTGGTGGLVRVYGSAEIETFGDYSSGIVAFSVGGDGGRGGSGSGAMPGGGGGFGGKGGTVIVDGEWDIKTTGDKSHGIWAKSLGGNAGNGGSGGWLFGKPGGGGQATDGGSVTLYSRGAIKTSGESSYGLYAQSVGGFGGSGGSSWGLFWSFGGNADSGGSGGAVEVVNFESGKVKTTGDYSHAILAQSIGGGGGSGGGKFGLLASLGGSGASGGSGGSVLVENDGRLKTTGTGAYGIFAQSVGGGGGDGGSVSGLVAIGGDGSQTSDGGDVEVINRGTIITKGELSHGIFAESIGGGGGNGGRSGGLVSIGGDGGSGGDAGAVKVTNEGTIDTQQDESYGLFAQSVGGGGGDGGFAISGSAGGMSVAVGGGGGKGGNSGTVDVTMDSEISTSGDEAYGIFAQSVGGGGGAGGFAIAGSYGGSGMNVNLGLGGKGGVGGLSDTVTVDVNGTIVTSGLSAHGILAQSVGGGGGTGGFAIAGSIGGGTNVNLAFGGDGGAGNKGGDVHVNGSGILTTENDDAHGIFAQSVGGSGGAGGFTVAASLGGGTSLNLALGGAGGDGSSAGNVTVGSETTALQGTLTTYGDRSYGIQAQSIGGGGGAGGASIAGALLGPGAISMGFGGIGGKGGFGGTTDVYNAATITTYGLQSHGLFAQSVGGGGGAGGLSIAGGVTAFGGLSLAMGGDGGKGNTGGDVTVHNSGSIDTHDDYSYGLFAQSIGGKGGAGGSSGAVMVNFSSLIPIPPEYPTGSVNISLSLGGDGGDGGRGGRVEVDNTGVITTLGDHSYGILAQSVGGGGGDGGKSIAATANISMPSAPGGGEEPQLEVQVDFAMALGGDGGEGNEGGEVDVSNRGIIDTTGIGAHGIFAQSVGGGGGSGGDARSMILSIDPSNWNPAQSPPDPTSISIGATLSLGGDGGDAGHGGTVIVTHEGTIITRGADAFGILAQSVGGGGGVGGGGYHGLDWEDFGVPTDLVPLLDLLPMEHESDLDIALGGSGGAGGDGDAVTVNNTGDIFTFADGSIGVFAQSIGGGGGLGGVGAISGVLDAIDTYSDILDTIDSFSDILGEIGVVSDGLIGLGGGENGTAGDGGDIHIDLLGNITTHGIAAHGVFVQSVGGGGGYGGNADRGIIGFGINALMGRGGSSEGDGGDIIINSEGSITTHGDGAIGIFAQSVGGGGGVAGGIGVGYGYAGGVGGDGEGGRVEVVHTGTITTYGDYAHGIFAQSVGGTDWGGEVSVTVAGDILVTGEGAAAVIAQSEGAAGKRNIDFIYESGTLIGSSDGTVRFLDGGDNSFTNYGAISPVIGPDGTAFLTTGGNDAIHNHGIISGSVVLGGGINEFFNYAEATFNCGELLSLGTGATLVNDGIFSPGGSGLVCTTALDGHLEQSASACLLMNWDMRSGQSDFLEVGGIADLGGQTQIKLLNVGYLAPGTFQTTLVTGAGGAVDSGLSLLTAMSAVMNYDLQFVNGTDVQLSATMDAAPAGLSPNQKSMGEYINRIQASGNAEGFAPFAAELFSLPDVESLGAAYDQLGPVSFDLFSASAVGTSGQYTSSLVKRMHSLRSAIQTTDSTMSIGQVASNAVWIEGFGHRATQGSVRGFSGYSARTAGTTFGFDYLVDEGFLAGVSGGYANTNVHLKNDGGRGDIDSYFGSLYGSWFTEQWYVDLALSYGRHRYSNYRAVQIGELSGIARSKHDADMWSAYIESGYNLFVQDWISQPFAALRYTCLDEESYRESGLEGANLYVDGRNTESLVMDLGIRFSRPYKRDDWVVIPELSVAWNHDFDRDSRRMAAAFDSAPAMKFVTDARDVERNGIVAGAGLTVISKDHVSISVNYNGEFRDRYSSHAFVGGIRVEF